MRKNTNLLLALFALLVFSSAATAQIVIDDFTSGNALSLFGPGNVSQTTTGSDILGGQRIDTLEVPGSAGSGALRALGFNVGGDLSIGQGATDQIIASLFYDSLGGSDLTGGGLLDAFQFDFTSNDNTTPITNVMDLTVTSGGTMVTQSVTIPGSGSLTPPVVVEFSDFVGVNFGSVDSVLLEIDFDLAPGRDFTLASFEAVNSVPEPGSLALLSVASLIVLRRRRT